jgi:hypothetical protein
MNKNTVFHQYIPDSKHLLDVFLVSQPFVAIENTRWHVYYITQTPIEAHWSVETDGFATKEEAVQALKEFNEDIGATLCELTTEDEMERLRR